MNLPTLGVILVLSAGFMLLSLAIMGSVIPGLLLLAFTGLVAWLADRAIR